MPIPAEANLAIFNEIIDALNVLTRERALDPFTKARKIRELEARAQELKDIDLALGFSAQGSIECMKGNIPEMHKSHKISLQYNMNPTLLKNYATSLLKSGDLFAAMSYAKVASDVTPGDPAIIDFMVRTAYRAEETDIFLQYAAKWEALQKEAHPQYREYVESLRELDEVSDLCLHASEHALAEIWDTPAEDEAWAHLQ